MTRTHKQQIFFSLAVTLLTLLLGAACGYLLGCALVLIQSQRELESYAFQGQERAAIFVEESFHLLNRLNASPASYCSDQELATFREQAFRAEFIRDIGRIGDGKLACSAVMGRLNQPLKLPAVEFTETYEGHSYNHYRAFPPLDGGPENDAVQSGQFYVILSTYRHSYLVPPPIQFVRRVGSLNARRIHQMIGSTFDISRYPLDKDGTIWSNGLLLVTRCKTRMPRQSCATTYVPVAAVLQAGSVQIWICVAVGSLVGFFFGLNWALAFRRSLGMERQLHRAIQKNLLQVVYQPIVELTTGRIVEAEALARWTDEDGFAISPAVFVPIAEQCGYVGELTELVVGKALQDLIPLLAIDPEFRVNVNITAYDLADESFLPMLERALAAAGIHPRSLAIEITESSTAKLPQIRQTIRELRQRGHSVQIDDFGTGYSSLSYLHDLSADAIKIDRAFTQSIGTEAVTVTILPQILAMARALNLQVIAEGIETADQAAYFAGAEGNILGQGWLFGHPAPAQMLLEQLTQAQRQTSQAQ